MKENKQSFFKMKKDPVTFSLIIIFIITGGLLIYFKLADGLNEVGKAIGEALAK